MKIAVLNVDGIKITKGDILKYYYVVDDDYDFSGNTTTNVTNVSNLDLFYQYLRIGYNDLRSSLISYAQIIVFDNLLESDKYTLVKNLTVEKVHRNKISTSNEQEDFALTVQEKIYTSNMESTFMINKSTIASQTGTTISNLDFDIVINSLVDPEILPKGFKSINYKSELKDGILLHPLTDININGLLNKVTYYNNYVDSQNLGDEILRVEFSWITDSVEPIPAAKTVLERSEKIWTWKNNDGTDNLQTKSKFSKKYDDINKRKKEGRRRRENLLAMTQEGSVISLIYSGNATGQTQAEEMLIDFFEDVSNAISTYMESGKGSVYDDINNSTRAWLDADLSTALPALGNVPTYLAMGLDASWSSKVLKDYIIDKLKGLV